MRVFIVIAALFATLVPPLAAQRITISLDGDWQVTGSVVPGPVPESYGHTAPVPGLANLARPEFPDVDRFESRGYLENLMRRGAIPKTSLPAGAGIARQERNYFWYRKTFRLPDKREIVTLKVNKAQFGTAVWLNKTPVGEHLGCFTAGYFDLTGAIDWQGENELVIRIGAHPGVLPSSVPSGTDFEKTKWTPGIYDSVSLLLRNGPLIESVQVAPKIDPPAIVVQTRVRNPGQPRELTITQDIGEWRGENTVAEAAPLRLRLAAGEERVITQTIPIPNAKLWTPETPHLYVLRSGTPGDNTRTRFGVREFRFDTATRRAYLNGEVYFLRGSNITLHRFFEDPECGRLPWDEKWVRKLLVEIPKKLHWNSFRFCIGPVPDRWLAIADETGLLIQHEFFVWTGRGNFPQEWDVNEMIRQYGEWVRDSWNHPSVVIWDANNETEADVFAERIIPAVRGLDLSNRPWENGYGLPAGPDDPVEDHPYLFSRVQSGREPGFEMTDLERGTGEKSVNSAHPTAHAAIVNEYGWLWLNRNGSPTLLTDNIYRKLVGENATAEERFEAGAYHLAGLTEYWRAHRQFAGILHFVYLTASFPGVFTSDHFTDVKTLELEPRFLDYVGQAFRPLGVYLNFWQPALAAGEERRFAVMLVNDGNRPRRGLLSLTLEDSAGGRAARQETRFEIPALGQVTYALPMTIPDGEGNHLLTASAVPEDGDPTISRRKVVLK